MTIPEHQLAAWSSQPEAGPSRDTYQSVKEVLEDRGSPFAGKTSDVFLQGSYGNDTNVARDSDVDVVSLTSAAFYHNAATLPADQYSAFVRTYGGAAAYTYQHYKTDVTTWLVKSYGSGVVPGKKAIFVPQGMNRRDCDVLPAMEYRHYSRFGTISDHSYASGICFFMPDGTQIVNYPKQHSENCTKKHQQTNKWFKHTVRCYKNIRNYMIDKRLLQEGVAPSYFIEGMLYNAPNSLFGETFQDTIVETFNYVADADRHQFKCSNGIHSLIGNSPVTWRAGDCQLYLDAMRKLWQGWS
ncbi:nucleotidyltransferase [Rhizobium leguminosarum]|uniref:nucleotidyltransferase domain-containing protein n=1 Tax=Rhizobium ruizarguesonis TaxID=2081791 RepID=UPI0013B6E58B|nr:nucleotidyltransferase [Rhizobium ruizarguesonis]NEJ12308.1 nucleotidyltransferase [Rhizobium ruizarguesonis]NEK26291.1 nucleotidyltransferase [Rhizobium ruizarguesonis]